MHPALVVTGVVLGYGALCGAAMYVGAKTHTLLEAAEAKIKAKLAKRSASIHILPGKEKPNA